MNYVKKKGIYELHGMAVSRQEITEIAEGYKEILWRILTDDVKCVQTEDNEVFLTKEDFLRLEKNVDEYVRKYPEVVKKPEVKIKKEKWRRRPRKKINKQKLFRLRREGKTMEEIAKILKVSAGTVYNRLKEEKKKKLPTLEKLKGSLKDLTKGKSTKKIIRKIKEGW